MRIIILYQIRLVFQIFEIKYGLAGDSRLSIANIR